jgi:hypothetical protein
MNMLVGRIYRVLQSHEAGRIDFTFGSVKVDAGGLQTVVTSIMLGTVHVAVRDMPNGIEAEYTPHGNLFKFPNYRYGSTLDDEAVIVHESVHAMQDINYGYDFSRGDYFTLESENEGAAYVAGVLYDMYRGNGTDYTAVSWNAAKVVANKIKDTPGAVVSTPDVMHLRDVIVHDPAYRSRTFATEDTYSDGAWR